MRFFEPAHGLQLGNPDHLTEQAQAKGVEVIRENASSNPANKQASERIRFYQKEQIMLWELANKVNLKPGEASYFKRKLSGGRIIHSFAY